MSHYTVKIEITDRNREDVMAMVNTVSDWTIRNGILDLEVESVPTLPIIYFYFTRLEDVTAFRLRYKL